MHELSIAAAILDQVAAEAARHAGARFTKVGIRVGELSGVDPEALAFGFEALKMESPWERLALEIEYCCRKQRCRHCQHTFTSSNHETRCPKCGDGNTILVAGEELDIAFIETEDE